MSESSGVGGGDARAAEGKTRGTVAVVATTVVLVSLLTVTVAHRTAHATSTRPNVVILMTDDQRWDTVTARYMPQLTGILSRNPSITYPNAFVPNSLCCPSRASTLTGAYSHTTGVYGNGGKWGGFRSFTPPPIGHSVSTINDTTTIAVDLHKAGYRTALIGKYLNGYEPGSSQYVPPGWDRWFAVATGVYYNYWATVSYPGVPAGTPRHRYFGAAPADYISRVLSTRATGFIDAPSTKPFFLYFAATAPHGPATPDPRDMNRFDLRGYVRPPSYGKAEAGAPNYIKGLPWDATRIQAVDDFHLHQLDATFGADRAIGQLWNVLPDNTIVLFMSDNGYSWGEHRWKGKMLPYNEDLRIPMMLVGKNLDHPLTPGTDPCPPMYAFTTSCDTRMVLNVDVLPTLEGLSGVATAHPVEGLNMLGRAARSDFVLEHWNNYAPPTYCGVRSAGWMYVRYNKSEEPVNEGLYDESRDPFEMNNLSVTAPNDPKVSAELDAMRHRARTLCSVGGGIYPDDWPYP